NEIKSSTLAEPEKQHLLNGLAYPASSTANHSLVYDWNTKIQFSEAPEGTQKSSNGYITDAWLRTIAVMPSVISKDRLLTPGIGTIQNAYNYRVEMPSGTDSGDCRTEFSIRREQASLNVYLNAINFFYREVMNRKITVNIRYSKTPKALPVVLTKEEVARLMDAITNPKHRLMAKLIYSAGLRVSELVQLKAKDLELDRNLGWVRKGKGNKDRLFIIAKSIRDELAAYISRENLPYGSWLFKGRKNGHLTVKAVQNIIKYAAKKARIMKNVHPHTLRHSFATHLVENGYDVASIQSLLGHNSLETTMVYIHAASPKMIAVQSPLDNMQTS
ncbi:MAG: tyrosine-type recombinase/integrase, partial [Nanoarchaeota archaeon]